MIDEILKVMATRQKLRERLMNALKHESEERKVEIITSWISVKELTELVEFQERDN